MQDVAPADTKRSTMAFLRERSSGLEDSPSGSPDPSPIEDLWAIMIDELGALSIEALEEIVRDI
jgi:transposase